MSGNGNGAQPAPASAAAGLWALVRLGAIVVIAVAAFAVCAGVWTHAVVDLFNAGWHWWAGR